MFIDRLSPSGIKVFTQCPKQWEAQYGEVRGADISGHAAEMGTACHLALERFVSRGQHIDPDLSDVQRAAELAIRYAEAVIEVKSPHSTHQEGLNLCLAWLARQDWTGKEIISTEEFRTIQLPTKNGDIDFAFVIDRLDYNTDSDTFEVVDYKSGRFRIMPDELRYDWQARCYAMSVWLDNPEIDGLWVTFDYLREGVPVSVYFSARQCASTYEELIGIAEEMFDTDLPAERLNSMCRFCIRKTQCHTLFRHTNAGGPLGSDLDFLLKAKHDAESALKGLEGAIAEIDGILKSELDASEIGRIEAGGFVAEAVSSGGRRSIDAKEVLPLVGADLYARYGSFGVTSLDALVKNEPVDDDVVSRLQSLVKYTPNRKSIKVKELK